MIEDDDDPYQLDDDVGDLEDLDDDPTDDDIEESEGDDPSYYDHLEEDDPDDDDLGDDLEEDEDFEEEDDDEPTPEDVQAFMASEIDRLEKERESYLKDLISTRQKLLRYQQLLSDYQIPFD